MVTLQQGTSILDRAEATTEEALQFFDSLEPVNLDFMFGRWQGTGIRSNHPMDGFLEAANWYGKEFVDAETVHPLLFFNGQGKLIKVAPTATSTKWLVKMPFLKQESLKPLLTLTNNLMKTDDSQARLRMMEYRGKVSATMIYDYLPINDAFRKIDDNTVFGIMDSKLLTQPFFFVLKRAAENV